jgi:hypothetical protein
MLEVELMHQWSTSTHRSVSDPENDSGIFQFQLPRWAMKHDFLFCGIMCLSALEISLSEDAIEGRDPAVYARVGIEYYDKAVSSFPEQLPKLPPEYVHLTYIFSELLSIINMAIPQCMPHIPGNPKESVREHVAQFMDLISGSTSLFLANQHTIQTGPVSAPVNQTLCSVFESWSSRLDQDFEGIFSRLMNIVENIQETPPTDMSMYLRSIEMLRLCYIEQSKPDSKGFCLAFPSLAGPDFISAYRDSEPLALYITLYWAVLLHGLEVKYWWARGVGKSLGEELSEFLSQNEAPSEVNQQWQEGLIWARKQMGLSTRLDSPLDSFLEGWEDG